jgi:hypothetical protein
MTIDSPNGG